MLKLNTLFTGKVLLRFSQLPSTNVYAQEILAKSRPIEGTVIKVEEQTCGRGQIGRKWLSEAGQNLTTSIILYPKFLTAREQFQLNIVVSLAVCSVVKAYLPSQEVSVKWPNDIYVENKKIAGILIQNALLGNHIQHTIIGIGLNVNQTKFPKNLPNPTSLKNIKSVPNFDTDVVLARLCEKIEYYYLQLKSGKEAILKEQYHKNLLGFHQERQFQKEDGSIFTGNIQGVKKEGQLIIKIVNDTMFFNLKEIKFLF